VISYTARVMHWMHEIFDGVSPLEAMRYRRGKEYGLSDLSVQIHLYAVIFQVLNTLAWQSVAAIDCEEVQGG
jgi:hypothetical protein